MERQRRERLHHLLGTGTGQDSRVSEGEGLALIWQLHLTLAYFGV